MMQRLIYTTLLSCLIFISCNNPSSKETIKAGDILFQDLDCGPMCDAIEAVTEGAKGKDYSHCAMIIQEGDSLKVIEAIGEGVVITSWKEFVERSSKIQVARLKKFDNTGLESAMNYAKSLLGKPYDDAFLLNNDRYYCSELLYEAFKAANYGKEVFELERMTFKDPQTHDFYPVWIDYYSNLKFPIPEGKPGLNPGSISRSNSIELLDVPIIP